MAFIQVKAFESISHLFVPSLIPEGTELVQDYFILAWFLTSFLFASADDQCNRQDTGKDLAMI